MNNIKANNQEIASSKRTRNDVREPKLRFKEFEGDWEKKKLNSINIKVIDGDRGKNYPNGNDFTKEGFCLFLNAKNVTKKGFSFITKSFINEKKDSLLRKGKLIRNDIVLTTRGSVGHIAYYSENIPYENLRINSGMVLIRTNSDIIQSSYLNKYLRGIQVQKEIKKISFGSAQPQLTVGEILKFKIAFPTLKEQQKITTFLTAVDTKIQQLTKKKTLLEAYKKGVMQQLFSQQLRFKPDVIANDSEAISNSKSTTAFPNWSAKKLGEYLILKSQRNKDLKVKLVLSVSNKKGFISQSEQFDGYEVASKDLSNYKIVKKNEITYNPSRINVGSIATLENFDEGIVSPMYVIFALKKELDISYFENLYQTHYFKHLIKVGCSGSVRDSLNFNDLSDFKLSFPSLKEQQKIATYLSAIDTKITNVQTQLEKTQVFKKGLLQGIFV